jgi:hypothetical protein
LVILLQESSLDSIEYTIAHLAILVVFFNYTVYSVPESNAKRSFYRETVNLSTTLKLNFKGLAVTVLSTVQSKLENSPTENSSTQALFSISKDWLLST